MMSNTNFEELKFSKYNFIVFFTNLLRNRKMKYVSPPNASDHKSRRKYLHVARSQIAAVLKKRCQQNQTLGICSKFGMREFVMQIKE